jgi:hypothetical protein
MCSDHTDLCLIQLRLAVRVAALPADQQLQSFPQGCDATYEFASDFGHWCHWALRGFQAPVLTPEQRASLTALGDRLGRMSGPQNAELWTDVALRTHPHWAEVRQDARRIQAAFGWLPDE